MATHLFCGHRQGCGLCTDRFESDGVAHLRQQCRRYTVRKDLVREPEIVEDACRHNRSVFAFNIGSGERSGRSCEYARECTDVHDRDSAEKDKAENFVKNEKLVSFEISGK